MFPDYMTSYNPLDRKRPSFMQEGGMVPVDGEGNLPPEAVASDVVNGAPMGMVDVPNGGGPVDDGVPTELPEGTVVINAAAIRFHGTETIDNLINTAVNELLSEGVQISMQDPNPEDNVPVAISNGEYIIPPEVAEKIGYKKLEDMNERGRAYLQKQEAQEKQQAEAQQQPPQPPQQPPEGFMGESMPPQQAGPPPAPVQTEQQAMAMMGMMGGGRVNYAAGGGGGTARVQAPVAPAVATAEAPAPKGGLIATLQNFMSQFGDNVSDMFGGEVKPTAKGFPVGLTGKATGTTSEKSTSLTPDKPPNKFAAPFIQDPLYSDETMPDPGNIFKAGKTQARAEGGFVGDYNYAQPQQATMGTPFPNAVDSNPQQSQSFLRPNDAKKKSRVGLEKGDTLREKLFPRPDNVQFNPALVVTPEPTTESKELIDDATALDAEPPASFINDLPPPQKSPTPLPKPAVPEITYEYAGTDEKGYIPNSEEGLSWLTLEKYKALYQSGLQPITDTVRTRYSQDIFSQVKNDNKFVASQNPSLSKEEIKEEVSEAINKAVNIFSGDSRVKKLGWLPKDIEEILLRTGEVESQYIAKRQVAGKEGEIARSFWQVQPTTAFDLISGGRDNRYFGPKFNKEFSRLAKGKRTALEHLQSLSKDELADLVETDANLGATLGLARYIDAAIRVMGNTPKPRKKPTPPSRENKASGGFISLEDGGKVSNRFKLFPPQKLQDFPTEQYQNLENELFDYAEELRKRSDGLQLSDAYPVDSPETEFIEKSFNDHIDRMAEQVIKGQGYINFERLLKDESGDTRSREKLEQYRESLKDDLHRMYQKPVYDIINSGLTEKEVSDGNELTYEESLQSVPGRQNIDNYYKLESDARRRLAKKPVDPVVSNPNEDKRQQPRATPNLNVFRKTPTFLDT